MEEQLTEQLTKEQIFDNIARRKMSSWGLAGFKKAFKTLYGVILEAMHDYGAYLNNKVATELLHEKKRAIIQAAALEKIQKLVTYIQTEQAGTSPRQVRRVLPQGIIDQVKNIADETILITKP